MSNDKRIHGNVAMGYDLRIDHSTDESHEEEDRDSGYFSEDKIPIDEDDEVSDEYFYAHLMDSVDDYSHESFINDREALSHELRQIPAVS